MRTPGGGTIILLCAALRERIREALKDLRLEADAKGQASRPPTVIDGYLPPKRSKDESEFPFVLVRPVEGSIAEGGFLQAKIAIIVGVFTEDMEGHSDALIVFQRILQSVQERPILDNRYTLQYPVNWELFEDQKYPFWQLVATTEWTVPTPVMLPDEGVL